MSDMKTYENGLRIVVESSDSARSVAVGFWVGVGSRYENEETNGLSHFTEHMLFKGTDKLSPLEVANAFENYGAHINAFTGKEYTCYYYKSVDEYNEKCFEILNHIFFDSVFDADELEKERKVVIEEINMVEDSPEDLCFDLISKANFGDVGLGRTILGPAEKIKKITRDDIVRFIKQHYSPQNLVISFAGNITLAAAEKLVEAHVLPKIGTTVAAKVLPQKETEFKQISLQKIKDFEQSNIILSFPSLRYAHPDMSVQSILNMIVGGSMSSRLFQSIRERQGLAYSVYASPSTYADCGNFNIVLNITPQNTDKVLASVRKELDLLKKEGIQKAELDRTKVQLKSSLVFSQENVQTQMSILGKSVIIAGEAFSMEKRLGDIDAVKLDAVNAFAQKLFDYEKTNAAYVGKPVKSDILAHFKH